MVEIKIIIPGELPGMNEIIASSKAHYGAYADMKRTNTDTVTWIAKSKIKKKCKKIDLVITWHCKDRRKDKDNISGGGTKFILDGLVNAGIIKNDGWKQIGDITHIFKVDKDNPRIEVEIEEVK